MRLPSTTTMLQTTHLCLVSEQALANLLPALDCVHACSRVALVVSPEMQAQAASERRVLTGYGKQVELIHVANAYDMGGIAQTLRGWLGAQASDARIELNATGGTKPMAMAAQDVFRSLQKPVFYLEGGSGQVMYLNGQGPGFKVSTRMELRAFVAAHGWSGFARHDTEADAYLARDALRALTFWMGQKAGGLLPALAALKTALGSLDGKTLQTRGFLSAKALGSAAMRDLRARLEHCGLVKVLANGTLKLGDSTVMGYLTGGWLERYVWLCLKDQPGVDDVAMSLKVARGHFTKGKPVPPGAESNEIDVAFISNNRLFALECKTETLSKAYTDYLYKVAFQRPLGGLTTRVGLLGLARLKGGAAMKRAENSRIALFGRDALPQLGQHLAAWLGQQGQAV